MFCNKCGKRLNEGDVFCSGCGAKIVIDDISGPSTGEGAGGKPSDSFHMDSMRWDLDGYPTSSQEKETKEPEFNWSSVIEQRGGARVSSRKFDTGSNFHGFTSTDGYPEFEIPAEEPKEAEEPTLKEPVIAEPEPAEEVKPVSQDAILEETSQPDWKDGATTRMDRSMRSEVASKVSTSDADFDYESSVFSASRGFVSDSEPVDNDPSGFIPPLNRGEASIFYTGSDIEEEAMEQDMSHVMKENYQGTNTFVLERVDIADAIQEATPIEELEEKELDSADYEPEDRYREPERDVRSDRVDRADRYYDEPEEEHRIGAGLKGFFGSVLGRFERFDALIRNDEDGIEDNYDPVDEDEYIEGYDEEIVEVPQEPIPEEPVKKERRTSITDRFSSRNKGELNAESAVDDFTRDIIAAKSASDLSEGEVKPRDPSDQFYTFNQKSEEFKALVEEEYERLRQRLREESGEDDLEAALMARRRRRAEEAIRALETEKAEEPASEPAAIETKSEPETIPEEPVVNVEPVPEPAVVEPAPEPEPEIEVAEEAMIEEQVAPVEPEEQEVVVEPEPAPEPEPVIESEPEPVIIEEPQETEEVMAVVDVEEIIEPLPEEPEPEKQLTYTDIFGMRDDIEPKSESQPQDTQVVDKTERSIEDLDKKLEDLQGEVDELASQADLEEVQEDLILNEEDDKKLSYREIFNQDEEEEKIEKSGRVKLIILDVLIAILAICVAVMALLVFGKDTAIGQKLHNLIAGEPEEVVIIPDSVQTSDGETTDTEGNGATETTGDSQDTTLITAAISQEASKNTNIGEIEADSALLFRTDKDYGIDGVEYAALFTDADWYTTGDGSTVTYLPELVGAVIEYNCKLTDRYNTGSEDVLALIDSYTSLYEEVSAIAPVEGVTHEITKLQIGEVRQDGDIFYMLIRVAENISDQEDPVVTTKVVRLNTEYNQVAIEAVADVQ